MTINLEECFCKSSSFLSIVSLEVSLLHPRLLRKYLPQITGSFPHLFKLQGFAPVPVLLIQFERSNMPAKAQNNGAFKKYVEVPATVVEEKHVDVYMAMNTTN